MERKIQKYVKMWEEERKMGEASEKFKQNIFQAKEIYKKIKDVLPESITELVVDYDCDLRSSFILRSMEGSADYNFKKLIEHKNEAIETYYCDRCRMLASDIYQCDFCHNYLCTSCAIIDTDEEAEEEEETNPREIDCGCNYGPERDDEEEIEDGPETHAGWFVHNQYELEKDENGEKFI